MKLVVCVWLVSADSSVVTYCGFVGCFSCKSDFSRVIYFYRVRFLLKKKELKTGALI